MPRLFTARHRWLVLASCLLVGGSAAHASDKFWNNPSGGTFSSSANWVDIPFQLDVPGSNDVANFGLTVNTGTFVVQRIYTVGFTTDPTNQALVIEDDFVTFDLDGGPSDHVYTASSTTPITIGTVSGRTGRLTITRGNVAVPAENSTVSWIAGSLQVGIFNGDLTVPSGGVLAPLRSVDGTTIKGDYNQQAAGATLAVEIGGPFQFTDYGVLTSEGAVVLGGTLQLTLTNGFVPTALNSFNILQADGGITGAFDNAANGQRLITSDGGGSFLINYGVGSPFDDNQIVLSAFQPGGEFTADFDEDGDVDGDDLNQWQGDFSANALSDADDDGDADGADFLAWQRQLGSGPAVTVAAGVPEPGGLILALPAGAMAYRFRRRFRRGYRL